MEVIPPAMVEVRVTAQGVRRILGIEHAHEFALGTVPAAKQGVGARVQLYGPGYTDANIYTPGYPAAATPSDALLAIGHGAYAFLAADCEGSA